MEEEHMYFAKRLASLTAVIAVAGLMLSLLVTSPVRGAGAAPVLVTNLADQPVPVTLQGTGSVGGTVNAVQSGTWTVGVSSLPAVNLAAGTTVGINNLSTAPIFTEDINNSAKQAFAVRVCVGGTSGAICDVGDVATLPAGKRFVIEQISGTCERDQNENPDTFFITAPLNGQSYNYYVSRVQGVAAISAYGLHRIVIGDTTRIYADDAVGISRFDLETDRCQATLSGHLVALN
jgi:hypothetical protein